MEGIGKVGYRCFKCAEVVDQLIDLYFQVKVRSNQEVRTDQGF